MAIGSGGQGQGTLFTEINITPLTDIFLVLLIIMMVIAPMFQDANQDIKMPAIQAGESVENSNLATVEITKDGQMFLNGNAIKPEELTASLETLAPTLEQKAVVIRADQTTPSRDVYKVFEAASAAGYEKLTIAGEPLAETRQHELQDQPEATP